MGLVDVRERLRPEGIQLVMKQGLAEVPLTGQISDFEDAVLIKRFNIDSLNNEVLQAGNRKLKAMMDTMNFRRNVMSMEWEHKSLRMQTEDLKRSLREIELFKVTKDIQELLRKRYRGLLDEKESVAATFDRDFDTLKRYYEKVFGDLEDKIAAVDKRIEEKTRENRKVDRAIADLHVDVSEQQLRRDIKFEEHETKAAEKRIAAIMQRSRLCSQIQTQHSEILVLQTELELLRLKTYPTLKYNTLNT